MIDFHAHHPSTRGAWNRPSHAAEDYLAVMDEAGIAVSVIFTLDGLFEFGARTNDDTAAFVAAAPERLLAFGTVDPRRPGALAEVERCLTDLSMRGLKFHPWLQAFSPQEPFMDPICATAASARVPILFHDGTPPYSTSLQIAALARRHPDTMFVLGHAGLHDLWREAVRATMSAGNVYACICGSPAYAIRRIVERCPADRVLFGTDGGLGNSIEQRYVHARVAEIRALLTPAEQDLVLERTPRALLDRVTVRGRS